MLSRGCLRGNEYDDAVVGRAADDDNELADMRWTWELKNVIRVNCETPVEKGMRMTGEEERMSWIESRETKWLSGAVH